MTPLSPTLSKLPLIFCGSPFSSLVTNCSSTVSSIQSLSFTRPPLLSTFLSATEHPTLPRALCVPYSHLLRRQQVEPLATANFREFSACELRRTPLLPLG